MEGTGECVCSVNKTEVHPPVKVQTHPMLVLKSTKALKKINEENI